MNFKLVFLSILISISAQAQFEWGLETAGEGNSICIDNIGNIIRVGNLSGTHDFDPGPGVLNLGNLSGNYDFYVQSLDENGNLNWAFQIGGGSVDIAEDVAVDDDNNIYITGLYQETVDFDPGPGTAILSGYIGSKTFVLKLNSDGEFVWVRGIAPGVGRCITVDNNNDIIYSGIFHGTEDFDPGTGVSNLSVNYGQQGVFISKLDSAGNFIWAGGLDGTCGWDESTSIVTDSDNNIYLGGMYCDSIDLDPGPATYYLAESENYLLKLSPDMNFIWGRSTPLPVIDPIYSINNTLLYTGAFQGTIDCDPGQDSLFITSSNGSQDPIIYEIDTSSNLVWHQKLSCTSFCGGFGLAEDNIGNIYASGFFTDSLDIDPGLGLDIHTSPFPMQKHYLVKFNNSMNYVWGGVIGNGINGIWNNVVSRNGNSYFTGYFEQSLPFLTPSGTDMLDSNNGNRFLFKIDNVLSVSELETMEKKIVKVYDTMGRETRLTPNTLHIILYSDGTSEKIYIVDL